MAESIANSHAACLEAFQKLLEIAQSGMHSGNWLLQFADELDKYRLWVGNLGAGHSGPSYRRSLDYRLRQATFYKDQVKRFLRILTRHIHKAHLILDGKITQLPSLRSLQPSSPASRSFQDAVSLDDSSDTDGSSSVTSCQKKNEDYKFADAPVKEQDGELQRVLQSINHTVVTLYRLPIRQPTPMIRLKDQSTSEMQQYRHFDILYIKDKFPKLQDEVTEQLGEMITRRRRLLLYRQRRQDRLREEANAPAPAQIQTNMKEIPQRSKSQSINENSIWMQSEAKATTVRPEQQVPLRAYAWSVPESLSQTSIAASDATKEFPLRIPPRPKDQDGVEKELFECKYCFLTEAVRENRSWKKHVLRDLQPYVCTIPGCNLAGHLFEDSDEWFTHEIRLHRGEFWCNVSGHEKFTKQELFEAHMFQEHNISTDDVRMSKEMFKSLQTQEGVCNLCFRETKSLKSHISRHLQQIALFAVPRADYYDEDESLQGSCDTSRASAQFLMSQDELESVCSSLATNALHVADVSIAGTEVMQEELEYSTDVRSISNTVPDSADPDWDLITDKFTEARKVPKAVPDMPEVLLPPCPRSNFSPSHWEWFTLKGDSFFDMCPDCLENIIGDSIFRIHFVRAGPYPENLRKRSDFSSPWFRLAWLLILKEKRKDLSLIYSLSAIAQAAAPCSGHSKEVRTWFGFPKLESNDFVPGFRICERDLLYLEALMPTLRGCFLVLDSSTEPLNCSFRVNSSRFPKHLDLLLDIHEATQKSFDRKPGMRPFGDAVFKATRINECPHDTIFLGSPWHTLLGLPEFTVCEECYEDVIFPDVKRGSRLAMDVTSTPQFVPGDSELVNGEGNSCHLYSPRMRRVWPRAVADNDLMYLTRKVLERRKVQRGLHNQHRELSRLLNEVEQASIDGVKNRPVSERLATIGEELEQVRREWRDWE